MIKGIGRDANPVDGDRIVLEVGIRDGKVVRIAPEGIIVGVMEQVGGVTRAVEFETGAEARTSGHETFGGCETARRAVLALYPLARDLPIEEALAVGVRDLIAATGEGQPENERCVLTVIGAFRIALINVHVAALAEASVEVKRLRVK